MTVLKVYLNWANSILKEIGKNINGTPEIQEGKVLCDLINIISPNCGIYDDLQGVQNVEPHIYIQNVLDHMNKNGIKVSYDVQDILDGDIKSILDCLWQIILNYHIHSIENNIFKRTVGIGKRQLLEWCQKHLKAVFDYRNTLTNNLCADNWLVQLLEKFDSVQNTEDRGAYVTCLLNSVNDKYGIADNIINANDIIDGTVDEHALTIYIALLKRKTEGNNLQVNTNINDYITDKTKESNLSISRESPTPQREDPTSIMSTYNQSTVRETLSEHIVDYMHDDEDRPDGPTVIKDSSPYLKEEEKPIILKRPKDYYHQWESNIDRLSQGPVSSPNLTDSSSAPEDLVLNIDDFNDSFDKSRSQGEALYKPDYSNNGQRVLSDSQRSESRSPTRTVDRFQNNSRREYRHSPEHRQSNHSATESGRQSRTTARFHGRRDDRSPSPEAYSHYDDLKNARQEVDEHMPKDVLGNRPSDYQVDQEARFVDSKQKRSRSDERDYNKSDDQVSERTKALRKRASASLERETRLRRLNKEKQIYNYNVTEDMIRNNLGVKSITYQPDPANVVTPLRHIGSAERIYKDEDSTFIKRLDVQRNPPRPYQLGTGHLPRREAWEHQRYSNDDMSYNTPDVGGRGSFLGSLDQEIDGIDSNVRSLERSHRSPRFASSGKINDKLWSQEYNDISSIRNPYRSDFNIRDDDVHLTFETRSRSLSPNRSHIYSLERPRTSLGVCEPSYYSTFRYEDVGLSPGKYPEEPLGRYDVRTDYYNPEYNSDVEITGTEIVRRPRSVSPSPGISLGYSGPVRRVNEEIWGTNMAEIHGLDPQRQEKWKKLINLTEMSNEDVIELKQALASAIVENDILFAKITNSKKEFCEKLLKTNEVLDDCRKHLATAQAENQELRTFLNQEKRINAALEARIKELEEQLTESVSSHQLVEEELHETVKMLEEAKRDTEEMDNYIAENERYKSKVSNLERDNSSLQQDLERLQETHERSQASMQELRKTLEDVRKERHDLYDELSRVKFRNQYGSAIETPVKRYSDISPARNVDVSRSRSTSPQHVRTFKPIVQTSSSPLNPPPYRYTPTSPAQERTSRLSSHVSERNTSPRRTQSTISRDPASTPVSITHVSRLSPLATRSKTATSYMSALPKRDSTSPIRPRSASVGRMSGLTSGVDRSYDYKPNTSSTNIYSTRSTSPYRYRSTSTTVPSTPREIYPHRKTRYQSPEKASSSDYNFRSSSATGFTDYPDLQRFPTRLKYSDYNSSSLPSKRYSAEHDDIKVPKINDSEFEVRREFDDDDEYEYKYTKKVTTITDHTSERSIDTAAPVSPNYDRLSRKDTSYYRSPTREASLRSRSQSPRYTANSTYDDNFRQNLNSVFDRPDSFRARSISPARFPTRGILKNAKSEQNLDYRSEARNSIARTVPRYTPPSEYTRSSPKNRVYITPRSSSSTNAVTTTCYDSANGVSKTFSPNTKYQIEIDGDLSLTVNGNLNVVNRDNIRQHQPPPLSEEQRYYANQLIDKYTKPSCSLRTVNL